MMPGEGIGPEMMDYVKDVYKAAGTPVDFGKYNHHRCLPMITINFDL